MRSLGGNLYKVIKDKDKVNSGSQILYIGPYWCLINTCSINE